MDEDGEIRIFETRNPSGVKTPVGPLSTDSWDKHDTGTGDVMGRLRLGEPSVTIRTEFFKPEKGRYLHPTEHRPITHYEAARIQGFPLDFRWCGSKTDIARQIGNAVPILSVRPSPRPSTPICAVDQADWTAASVEVVH